MQEKMKKNCTAEEMHGEEDIEVKIKERYSTSRMLLFYCLPIQMTFVRSNY